VPRVQPHLLLDALGLEGTVTIWRADSKKPYHAIFRHGGAQINRSTGKTNYAEAQARAAEIYAEIVRGPKEAVTMVSLERKMEDLKTLVLRLSLNGARSGNPHVRTEVKTLKEGYDAFISAKKIECIADSTLNRLQRRLDEFVGFVGPTTCLPEISSQAIERWVASKPTNNPRSQKNDVDVASQLMRWCGNPPRRWCDPEIGKGVSKPRVSRQSSLIEVITPDQAKAVLKWIEDNNPEYALFYAIALFAGARANKKESSNDKRSGEIIRLFEVVKKNKGQWPAKLWNGLVLHIPSGKVNGAPRQIHTPENLKRWMEAYPESLEIPHRNWHTKHIAKPFGLPPNGLRHTAASAFISSGGDFGRASVLFGNSEGILKSRYVNLMVITYLTQ
jgi:integrase